MHYGVKFSVVAAIFACSVTASGQQRSSPPFSDPAASAPATSGVDCRGVSESSVAAQKASDPDQPPDSRTPADVDRTEGTDPVPPVVNLEQDLNILRGKQEELAQCVLPGDAAGEGREPQGACLGQLLLNFEARHDGEPERDVPIGRLPGSSAFFYESGMTIDADGAPNAYHPDNIGLDDLANAGTPGRWEGLAKDHDGQPIIQGPDDPFPGYYISATALADRSKAMNDPARYVDASKIPFVVLPGGMSRQLGARPGDFAVVFNQRNGKSSYAIFGDVGPFDRIGEGSVALAENLGIRSDARNGGTRGGVFYLVFPGSGNGTPRTIDEIEAEGQKLLLGWEASTLPFVCRVQQTLHRTEGNHDSN